MMEEKTLAEKYDEWATNPENGDAVQAAVDVVFDFFKGITSPDNAKIDPSEAAKNKGILDLSATKTLADNPFPREFQNLVSLEFIRGHKRQAFMYNLCERFEELYTDRCAESGEPFDPDMLGHYKMMLSTVCNTRLEQDLLSHFELQEESALLQREAWQRIVKNGVEVAQRLTDNHPAILNAMTARKKRLEEDARVMNAVMGTKEDLKTDLRTEK